MTNLNNSMEEQIVKKNQNMGLYMNCLAKNVDASIQVPLKVEVQPESCGIFSVRLFVFFLFFNNNEYRYIQYLLMIQCIINRTMVQ